MLKQCLEQRHIILGSDRSCLALEKEFWEALETLAHIQGWNSWRDFFSVTVLPEYSGNTTMARHVRKFIVRSMLEMLVETGEE
jgi:hypothetical protein